jgi:hypothetical protein
LELTIPLLWVDLYPSGKFSCSVHLNKGESLPLDSGFPGLFIHPRGPRIDPVVLFERLWNARAILDTPGEQHRIQSEPLSVTVRETNGRTAWRSANLQMTYEVDRKTWLGQFTPDECRGLVDYLDDNAFIVSHLPVGQIPFERDERWVAVS